MPENVDSVYRELIKDTINELKAAMKTFEERMSRVDAAVAVLQYKSGVWGAIGALATILGLLLVEKLKK